MDQQTLEEAIENSPTVVHAGRYAYLKLSELPTSSEYFLLSQDADEITAVVEERAVAQFAFSHREGPFTLIEFRVNQPFQTVGFLAAVTRTVAEAGENVLVVSTFSRDYILLTIEGTERALRALTEAGFTVVREHV